MANLIGERPFSAGKEYDEFVAHMKEKPLDTEVQAPESSNSDERGTPPSSGDSNIVHAADDASDKLERNSDVKDGTESTTSRIMKEIKNIIGIADTPTAV